MSELRTDFKDEILQEGEEHRIYNIKRKDTNEEVESNIYLEKAYTPLQEGNEFGAKEVNEIHGRLNGLAPQNLLINGDFKINQRGQSSYNYSTNGKYGLDCWMNRQGSYSNALIVEQLNGGGVKLTFPTTAGGGLRQYIKNVTPKVGEKYTTSFMLDGTIYSGTTTLMKQSESGYEHVIKNDIFTLELYYDDTNDCIVWSLWMNNGTANTSHEIKYADLFEGSIAYPHVEEDDATALMRCREKIRKYDVTIVDYSFINDNYLFYIIPNGLGEHPTLSIILFDVQNQGMAGQGFSYAGISIVQNDNIIIQAYKANHGVLNDEIKYPLKYLS